MNRQVGPSIVLSVLIVGFFAVALFPRDPRSSPTGRPAVERRGVEARRSGEGGPADSSATRRPSRSPWADKAAVRPVRNPAFAPVHAPAPALSPMIQPLASTGETTSPSGGVSPAAAGRDPVRPVSSAFPTRSIALPSGARLAVGRLNHSSQTTVIRRPRSAFTVVEANETVRDVALRVYGSQDEVDQLWRANRDTLPSRDSPVLPGTLLRTPRIR